MDIGSNFSQLATVTAKTTTIKLIASVLSFNATLPGFIELVCYDDNLVEIAANYTRLYRIANGRAWLVEFNLPTHLSIGVIYARYRIPYQPVHNEKVWLTVSVVASSNYSVSDTLGTLQNAINELSSQVLELSNPANPPELITMPRVLQHDANWGIQMAEFQSSLHWISYINGQNATGSITYGTFLLSNKLGIAVSGHATTEQVISIVVDDVEVISVSGDVALGAFRGSPYPVLIDTSEYSGELASLKLTDNHSGGNGWIGVNFASLLLID